MPIVVAKGLVKAYGTRTLLAGVDVSIHERERVGLVGDNGAGKSTLARILAGLEATDEGEVAVRRGAEIAYLAQEPELPADATARDAVLVGLGPWLDATTRHAEISARIGAGEGDLDAEVAAQAELDHTIQRLGGWERGHEVDGVLEALGLAGVTATCGSMSGGERRRVALARLLVSRPALAVLDEPTNHLDADAIDWLERYLAERFDGALLLLTHDRWLLDRLVDRTLELERGKLYTYEGGWDAYLEGKAERVANEQRTEDNRRNFLRTELEWLRRSPAARTTKQRARVDRAEAAIANKAPAARRATEFSLETTRIGKTIVDARGLNVVAYGRTVVRSLDFALRKGERIGIVGPNGAGKTTLLRVLMGELEPTGGEVVRGENTRFAYLDQFRSGLDPDVTLEDAVGEGRRRVDFQGKAIDVRGYLGRFLFGQDDLRKKVAALSGGERARMSLARLFLMPANVLVLDEPTNDLDVTTLSSLESMIVEGEMTALIVSHDRYFLDRAATAILELDGRGGATLYQGNWDVYRRLKAEAESARREEAARAAEAAKKATQEKSAREQPKAAARKGLTYAERIELGTILDVIAGLETELEALEAILADPATYSGGRDPRETIEKRDALRAKLDATMERWMDLEARSGG